MLASNIVSVQGITFGLIARKFAAVHHILPTPARARQWLDAISMERMLQCAGALLCIGTGGLLFALASWAGQDFGSIEDGHLMRVMVLAVSALVIAVQLGLSGFLLGVLDLRPGDARSQQAYLSTLFPSE